MTEQTNTRTVNHGCTIMPGIGGILAVVISVMLNKSFWWALLHGMFGWFYVLYAFTVRHNETVAAFHKLFN